MHNRPLSTSIYDHSATEQCRDTHDEGDNEKPNVEWLKLEIRTTHAVGHKESQWGARICLAGSRSRQASEATMHSFSKIEMLAHNRLTALTPSSLHT
jgi:hypothetical protein